jgi:HTH-type transcriptional regulator, competence development regulator
MAISTHAAPPTHPPAPLRGWQEFGAYLRGLRQTQGSSLRQFAKQIPLSPSYYSQVERGLIAPPSAEVLLRIATLLGVSAVSLLARAGKLPPATWEQLWAHPALPAILSTLPGMTLDDASRFCAVVRENRPMIATRPHQRQDC